MSDESGQLRTVLHQTESFEIVSIRWSKGDSSPMHNHGWSQCMVMVEEGLFENILDLGFRKEIQLLEVGQVLEAPIGAKHEMHCRSETGKTLHVYTPQIVENKDCGNFTVERAAALRTELSLGDQTKAPQLRRILTEFRQASISTHSPYFMNQLFSGVLPQTLLVENLLAQTKTTMATFEASPVFSVVEAEVVETLGRQIGWQEGQREGLVVPGGSAANFMALHCARQRAFPQFKHTGMNGKQLKIFVSSEAHYSFKKACVALGIGSDNLVLVPANQSGQIDIEKLDQLIQEHTGTNSVPIMVAATAGTTVLGAFDPIEPLSQISKKYGLWLHVDGAWGGPAIFSKQLKYLVQGIENADSVTFDAHKLFAAGLTCTFYLTRHAGLLAQANDVSGGDYLFHADDSSADRGKISWQCGRRADALSFWTIWKSVGTEGLGDFVDRLLAIQKQTVAWVRDQSRLHLIAAPEYLNICLRVQPPRSGINAADWSRHVRENLKENNLAMVNYSTNSEGTFLRLILTHPYLQFAHVQQILQWALAVE